MAVTRIDTHKDYLRYATHSSEVVPEMTDDHAIDREIATEWLKLTRTFIELLKPINVS
jgi:hypothetical protein